MACVVAKQQLRPFASGKRLGRPVGKVHGSVDVNAPTDGCVGVEVEGCCEVGAVSVCRGRGEGFGEVGAVSVAWLLQWVLCQHDGISEGEWCSERGVESATHCQGE
jgi:hypothetical protein